MLRFLCVELYTLVIFLWHCLLLAILFAGSAHAAEFQLFTHVEPTTEVETGEVHTGRQSPKTEEAKVGGLGIQIQTSETLKQAQANDILAFSFEGTDYRIRIERREVHSNGDVSLIGRVDGTDHGAIITRGATGSVGRIATDEGIFSIKLERGSEKLISPADRAKMILLPIDEGGVVPLGSRLKSNKELIVTAPSLPSYAEQKSTSITTIDIMVFWDQEFQDAQGGVSEVRTALNQMVAYSNQAFIDSEIYIRLWLVNSANASYPNYERNSNALFDISNSRDVFSNVPQLRNTVGADLVGLVRQYNGQEHGNCGAAYILGYNEFGSLRRDDGFFIVSSGRDDGFLCNDNTFPHEIGHNLGSEHDHNHAGDKPLFPYSYGHDTDNTQDTSSARDVGNFATIMSYDKPEVAKFSNPNITCGRKAKPCGIPEGSQNPADNARGFNNIRFDVEGFSTSRNYVLIIGSHTNGSVSSELDGATVFVCGNDCSGDFYFQSEVTLTATPDAGYTFRRWGGDCSGADATTVITIDKAKTCEAIFTRDYGLRLRIFLGGVLR